MTMMSFSKSLNKIYNIPFCKSKELFYLSNRYFSQPSNDPLKERLVQLIPEKRKQKVEFLAKYGGFKLGDITIEKVYGGMRFIGLTYETSLLDEEEGIRFRGYSIPECQKLLPKASDGVEPLPESLFWLLLTGDIPTTEQVKWLSNEWVKRATLPPYLVTIINSLPYSLHPMAQFSTAVTALSGASQFASAYASGKLKKEDFWITTYEDSMNIIAKLPTIAAMIYRNTYNKGKIPSLEPNKDWGYNYSKLLGFDDKKFAEFMRLYLLIHSDHEGGNVSAHTVRLVGSALSNPYLAYSSGLNGLAGPLHGLANQEVLSWLNEVVKAIGNKPTDQELETFCRDWLKKSVIPGYGHAVLRKTDPRFTCQADFAKRNIQSDPLIKLVHQIYKIVPAILIELGKAKNPWPNVDAHSGVILQNLGLVEKDYYTVPFGVSRALGVLSSLVWDRALGLPLERPKSVTTELMKKMVLTGKVVEE